MLTNLASSSQNSHVFIPFSPTSFCDLAKPFVDISILAPKPIPENLKRKRKKREWELNHVLGSVGCKIVVGKVYN